MDYLLRVKKKGVSAFSDIDLFENANIELDLDFYNVDSIEQLKIPVSISLDLPMTDNNVAVIDYDPRGNTYTNLPTEPFDFELKLNGSSILRGNLYVDSMSFNNDIPIVSIRLVDRLQEIFSNVRTLGLHQLYDDKNTEQTFSQFLFANQGSIGTLASTPDIAFPYIDFCNDTRKFGFASRQFIQYGIDKDRVGIVPAFNIPNFVSRFFSESGVTVTSKFFQLGNYGTAVSGVDPDYMYMVVPARLGVSGDRNNQRTVLLREGRKHRYLNEYTVYNSSIAREVSVYPEYGQGWNYGTQLTETDGTFGYIKRNNIANSYNDLDNAFFAPHMQFIAMPPTTTRTIPSGGWIGVELPLISLNSTNYSTVTNINTGASSARFKCVAVVFKDGLKHETFDMIDVATGEVKLLNASDATLHPAVDTGIHEGQYLQGYTEIQDTSHNNVLRWSDTVVGDFYWEQKEFDFEPGSTYAYGVEFVIQEGSLNCEYSTDYVQDPVNGPGLIISNNTSTANFKDFQFPKGVFRSSDEGNVHLVLEESGNSAPYFDDDLVNVYSSLRDNATAKPYDLLKEILQRFNLSVVYDQNTDSVLVDRLPDIRQGNTALDITNQTDDADSFEVNILSPKLEAIKFNTLKGLFYDEFGEGEELVDESGNTNLTYSLKSRVYNRSLCGEDLGSAGLDSDISQFELGIVDNEFTPVTKIGVVFAYLDVPQFTTNIKRSRFTDRGDYKGILYNTYTQHTFFGRLVGERNNSISLSHFDKDGNTTDLYTFFTGNDNIKYLSSPKLKFTGLIDPDYIYNIKDNYGLVQFDHIQNNNLIIKSINGISYDAGVYAEIEAIIL